jgi:hypothetical protein
MPIPRQVLAIVFSLITLAAHATAADPIRDLVVRTAFASARATIWQTCG